MPSIFFQNSIKQCKTVYNYSSGINLKKDNFKVNKMLRVKTKSGITITCNSVDIAAEIAHSYGTEIILETVQHGIKRVKHAVSEHPAGYGDKWQELQGMLPAQKMPETCMHNFYSQNQGIDILDYINNHDYDHSH